MLRHRKLALACLIAGTLVWALRTGSTPNSLYPIIRSKANIESVPAPSASGVEVRGRVLWKGPQPKVAALRRPRSIYYPHLESTTPNPLVPRVSPTGGLADVFLVLEGPGVAGIPWNHPPTRVEWDRHDCAVLQGDRRGRFGLVRTGTEAEFVSREANGHSARARGADFFTLMLTTPHRSVKRVLDQPGLVEITSGSWFYWAQARLWVSPHGGCALTDDEGNFRLPNVSPGAYQLTAIRANWNVARLDKDPEFPIPVRANFENPVILKETITVGTVSGEPIRFEMSDEMFTKSGS